MVSDRAGCRILFIYFFCVGGASSFGRSDRDTVERVGAGGTPLCCRRNRVSAMRSGTFWTGQYHSMVSWARLPPGLVALCFLCLAHGWWSVGWNGRYVPISLGCLNLPPESSPPEYVRHESRDEGPATLYRRPYGGETPLSHIRSLWKQERWRVAQGCYFCLFQQMRLLL